MTLFDYVPRSLHAKRLNEGLKLLATGLNNLSVAFLVGAFVNPLLGNGLTILWVWIPVAVALHVFGQILLHSMKDKE